MSNVPCRNPKLCGVKSHRPGTQALCQQDSASTQKASSGDLSATPKLGSSESAAPTVELNAEGEALLASALQGKVKEVVVRNDNGTQVILTLNNYGDKGNMFYTSDQSVTARIKTADGLKVYAADFGAQSTFHFKDGEQATSWTHPVDDDGEYLSSKITLAEFQSLEDANRMATETGWCEDVNPTGSLSVEDSNRESVRRVLALRDEAGVNESSLPKDAQELSDATKEAIEANENVVDYYTNNIVGQYLDQVLQGKGVDQMDQIDHTDYLTNDDDLEVVLGIEDQSEENWEQYQEVLGELEGLGVQRAQEWLKKNVGTEEFGEWVSARAGFNKEIKGAYGASAYRLQQDWSDDPLSFH